MTVVVRLRIPLTLLAYRNSGRTKCDEEGRCRLCHRSASIRPLTRHHLVPQVWFKRRSFVMLTWNGRVGAEVERYLIRDCDSNVVPLCAPCHALVEDDVSYRRMLRKRLGSAEVAFVIALRGLGWFDTIYPRRRADDVAAAA